MLDFTTPDPVALHARLRPDALACLDLATGKKWTYAALDADIERAVVVLRAKGVTEGDRVAVLARNSGWQVVMQQALIRMGGIFVPLNWRLSEPEIDILLADCAPRHLYRDLTDFAEAVELAVPGSRCTPRSQSETCTILYTSGTSGTPKGAMLSASCLLATAVNFGVLGEVDSNSVFLCDTPIFHVIGLVTQIWPALLRGGTCLISPGFDPELTNTRLADPALRVTHYFCVPQMAEGLRHARNFAPDRWALKALFTGGAPNPAAHIHWWLDRGVPMVDGYGMTECGTILGMPLSARIVREKAGAVGLPGPLTRVRLVDEEGREVPQGTEGEVLVHGPNVIRGYWNREDSALGADGWLRTGDVGRADTDGYITIVDRRKDMFISGGENVYPVEVESVMAAHPAIREVAVIGVPDSRWGEVGRAFVVLVPGQAISENELAQHCEASLARYKIPKTFVTVDALPRTASGKVMKHILRDEFLTA
ncbi:AMP-binding protein [Ensifer sp. T173]|uniref:3-methylmercaptopropionyl-CoA ligase n=1 Tax=Ensifer canadensis TaxID=555315 RepID=A0AAW4FY38_9HYPH|nr:MULTISPECIES: AMP-binding protein [Ensifer]KQU78646.1 acyl-CoA synthetase [Ensifer sp. Root31]MBM3096032.1 AMP-binding protein [Ensifer canadensis]UBI79980.1 AMP-binding protein [Ensifer canadensis]